MFFYEDLAAIAVFVMCAVSFVLGGALRYWLDDARAEFVSTYANVTEGRRANHGGR